MIGLVLVSWFSWIHSSQKYCITSLEVFAKYSPLHQLTSPLLMGFRCHGLLWVEIKRFSSPDLHCNIGKLTITSLCTRRGKPLRSPTNISNLEASDQLHIGTQHNLHNVTLSTSFHLSGDDLFDIGPQMSVIISSPKLLRPATSRCRSIIYSKLGTVMFLECANGSITRWVMDRISSLSSEWDFSRVVTQCRRKEIVSNKDRTLRTQSGWWYLAFFYSPYTLARPPHVSGGFECLKKSKPLHFICCLSEYRLDISPAFLKDLETHVWIWEMYCG